MLIIVFSIFGIIFGSVLRKSETKIDEQGRKYHYSEKYEEEFSYEIQKCFDNESDKQLEFQNEMQYDDENIEGFGEGQGVHSEEEIIKQEVQGFGDGEEIYEEQKEEKINNKIKGFGKGENVFEIEELQEQQVIKVKGFGKGEEIFENEVEIKKVKGFGEGEEIYEKEEEIKKNDSGFGEALGTIDDYEQQQQEIDLNLVGNLRKK